MLRLLSFFLVIMVLKKLDLIDSINIEKCDTSHPVICNCSNIGLSDLPENITHEADRNFLILDFSRNFIRTFPSGAFHTDNRLSSLLLDNNIISKIESRAFKALTNLGTLYMSGNNLDGHRISESQFDGLINLKTLKINHNPLLWLRNTRFPTLMFHGWLDLSCHIVKYVNLKMDQSANLYILSTWILAAMN